MKKYLFILCILYTSICFGQSNTLTITEINYNSDSTQNSGDWFELYNYGSTTIDLGLFRIRDSSATGLYLVQPSVSIAAGGYLVFCTDTQQFDALYNITNRIGNLGFGFNNNTDGIRIYDNANELVIQLFYQDSLPWPIGADGFGRTLELINSTLDPALPDSWRTGCILGSPGTSFIPCTNETIVISEINYKSSPAQDAGDWFEIRNIGLSTIDISNYIVRDSKNQNEYVIPSGTVLASQGSVVVLDNPTLFNQQFPFILNKVGPCIFSLAGDGECIRLYNATDKIIFSIYYDDDLPWTNLPDANGYTLEADTLFNFSRDVNNSTSWFAGCPEGSPGKKYNPDCFLNLQSTSNFGVSVYPNPANEFIKIDFNYPLHQWKVKIYNTLGQEVICLNTESIINVNNLMEGTYILKLETLNFNIYRKILITHESF